MVYVGEAKRDYQLWRVLKNKWGHTLRKIDDCKLDLTIADD